MQQRFGTVLAVSLAVLVLSACGGQQLAAGVPSPSAVDSADALPSAATSAPPTAVATASAPSVPSKVPATGRPSGNLCDAGEKYLTKFPGLPQVKSPTGATPESALTVCAYMAVIGDLSAPSATLGAADLTRKTKDLAMFELLCSDEKDLKAGFSKIDGGWVQARGWAAWTKTDAEGHLAIFCTDDHYFSASILNVPGSTQQDALNTILAAIE